MTARFAPALALVVEFEKTLHINSYPLRRLTTFRAGMEWTIQAVHDPRRTVFRSLPLPFGTKRAPSLVLPW